MYNYDAWGFKHHRWCDVVDLLQALTVCFEPVCFNRVFWASVSNVLSLLVSTWSFKLCLPNSSTEYQFLTFGVFIVHCTFSLCTCISVFNGPSVWEQTVHNGHNARLMWELVNSLMVCVRHWRVCVGPVYLKFNATDWWEKAHSSDGPPGLLLRLMPAQGSSVCFFFKGLWLLLAQDTN